LFKKSPKYCGKLSTVKKNLKNIFRNMKKERPQNKNLKPPFTSEQAREQPRETKIKAGIKSGKARRNLSEIREWLEQDLFEIHKNNEGKKAETFKIIFNKLKSEALKGNTKAIEMYLNYAGLKPVDKIEQTNPSIVINNNTLSIEKLKELKEKLNEQ
jgi:hypothetical protein